MANFEAFFWVISSTINLLFLKSADVKKKLRIMGLKSYKRPPTSKYKEKFKNPLELKNK